MDIETLFSALIIFTLTATFALVIFALLNHCLTVEEKLDSNRSDIEIYRSEIKRVHKICFEALNLSDEQVVIDVLSEAWMGTSETIREVVR